LAKAARTGRSQTVYIGITARTPPSETLVDDAAPARLRVLWRTNWMHTPPRHHVTRLALAGLVATAVLVSLGAGRAAAAPQAIEKATAGCWLQVVNDWLDNNRVDKTYPIPCYTQAIQHLNQYPDVRQYSSAADDIRRALQAAVHDRSTGGGSGGGGGSNSSGGAGGSNSSGGGGGGGGGNSPVDSAFNSGKPSSATSVPVPLIVLGVLAVLLLLAAGGTWLLRRFQTRRVTPMPQPAPAPAPRRRP
jgi:hypothetical protein